MHRLFRTLFSRRFGAATLRRLESEANDLHARMRAFITCLLTFYILGIVVNLIHPAINLWISLPINIFLFLIATRPRLLAIITGAGAATNPGSPIDGATDLGKKYMNIVYTAQLYLSIFLLFAGMLHFRNNIGGIGLFTASVLVICWADIAWGFTTRILKPAIYGLAIVTTLFALGSFINHSTYMHWLGTNPYNWGKTSTIESKLNEIDEALATTAPQTDLNKLDAILKKIENGEALTGSENATLAGIRSKRSAPGKILSLFKREGSAPPIDKVVDLPSGEWEVSANDGRTAYWMQLIGSDHIRFLADNYNFTVITDDGQRFQIWKQEQVRKLYALNLRGKKFYIETEPGHYCGITAKVA